MVMVALGGALGAWLRWVISLLITPIPVPVHGRAKLGDNSPATARFPLPTLIANLMACVALGLTIRYVSEGSSVYPFLAVGLCGGLSTYSTFAVELTALIREHHHWFALAYLGISLGGGLLALMACSTVF